jgi:hypothetical protein
VTCSSGVTNALMSHEASAGDAPGVSRINAGLLFLRKEAVRRVRQPTVFFAIEAGLVYQLRCAELSIWF